MRYDLGCTVNDVALAAVTGGFRPLLLSRHEVPAAHMPALARPGVDAGPGRRVDPGQPGLADAPFLPVHLADPEERLVTVKRRVLAMRAAGEPEAGDSITTIAEYGPSRGLLGAASGVSGCLSARSRR